MIKKSSVYPRSMYFHIPQNSDRPDINGDMTQAVTKVIFDNGFGHVVIQEDVKDKVEANWKVWSTYLLKALEIEKKEFDFLPFQNVFVEKLGISNFKLAIELMMAQLDSYKENEEIINKVQFFITKAVSKLQVALNKYEWIIDITLKEKDIDASILNPSFEEVEKLFFNGHFESAVQKARDILAQRHKQITNIYKYFVTGNANILSSELNTVMQTITNLRNKLFKNSESDELASEWGKLTLNQKELYTRLMIDLIKLIENQILLDTSTSK